MEQLHQVSKLYFLNGFPLLFVAICLVLPVTGTPGASSQWHFFVPLSIAKLGSRAFQWCVTCLYGAIIGLSYTAGKLLTYSHLHTSHVPSPGVPACQMIVRRMSDACQMPHQTFTRDPKDIHHWMSGGSLADVWWMYIWYMCGVHMAYVYLCIWYMYLSDRCLAGVDRCLVRYLAGIWHLSNFTPYIVEVSPARVCKLSLYRGTLYIYTQNKKRAILAL